MILLLDTRRRRVGLEMRVRTVHDVCGIGCDDCGCGCGSGCVCVCCVSVVRPLIMKRFLHPHRRPALYEYMSVNVVPSYECVCTLVDRRTST